MGFSSKGAWGTIGIYGQHEETAGAPIRDSIGVMGVPKIRGTFLGFPIIRTIVFCGLSWGPLFWETTFP